MNYLRHFIYKPRASTQLFTTSTSKKFTTYLKNSYNSKVNNNFNNNFNSKVKNYSSSSFVKQLALVNSANKFFSSKTAMLNNANNSHITHTRIEEELHETAHIDYDRVAIQWNPSVAQLYEDALKYETGSAISSTGALVTASGIKTGRSPKDKRIVDEPGSTNDIWVSMNFITTII